MRVLITGVSGFAGSHLAEYILAHHQDVALYGTYRWRSKLDNLEEIAKQGRLDVIEGAFRDTPKLRGDDRVGRLTLLHCDLTDPFATERLVAASRPEWVFHLAAQSFVQSSFYEPAATFHTNVVGQLNLLEAIRKMDDGIRVHVAGSSEEYGLVHPDEVPMKETNPLRPLSPYSVSKVAQDKLAWQYFKSYGLQVVTTRAFNHTGPRRGNIFVTSTFARQIAEVEHGLRKPVLHVGDLTSKRDWHDVRDTARAYWLALEKGEAGEVYNVGAGRTVAVGEMLETLLGFSAVKVDTVEDPARLRPSDVPILWADVTKFRKRTGWEPTIPFKTTLHDLLNYWRERVTREHIRLVGGM
jgi:GDP-4-dehydro-6-deoxy-D-mannose reductase